MVFVVRVVGIVLHDRTRGRGFVASVHAVDEVEMISSTCEMEIRSRAKGTCEFLNRQCTDDGKAMDEGVSAFGTWEVWTKA